jgi:hypothetical protein
MERGGRLKRVLEVLIGALVALILVGSALGFGGLVWWAPVVWVPLVWAGVGLLIFRLLLERRWGLMRSGLGLCVAAVAVLAVIQLLPLPGRVLGMLSPHAHEVHAWGTLGELARTDDPELGRQEAEPMRGTISLDRSATVRVLAWSMTCWGMLVLVSRYSRTQARTMLVWGSVVTGFAGLSLLGFLEWMGEGGQAIGGPGTGVVMPTQLDAWQVSAGYRLRPAQGGMGAGWLMAEPQRARPVGLLHDGSRTLVPLGAVALPLALGMLLHRLAPRGSREGIWTRLHGSIGAAQAGLCGLVIGVGLVMVGWTGGPLVLGAILLGLVTTVFLAWWGTGLTWRGVLGGLLGLGLASAAGFWAWIRTAQGGGDILSHAGSGAFRLAIWTDMLGMLRDFGTTGTGLGSFPRVYPLYKSMDLTVSDPGSGVLRWWVETGVLGMGLVLVGVVLAAWSIMRGVREMGGTERALAGGLVGAVLAAGFLAVVHPVVTGPASGLALAAVGGTALRWFSGATDLWLELDLADRRA